MLNLCYDQLEKYNSSRKANIIKPTLKVDRKSALKSRQISSKLNFIPNIKPKIAATLSIPAELSNPVSDLLDELADLEILNESTALSTLILLAEGNTPNYIITVILYPASSLVKIAIGLDVYLCTSSNVTVKIYQKYSKLDDVIDSIKKYIIQNAIWCSSNTDIHNIFYIHGVHIQ